MARFEVMVSEDAERDLDALTGSQRRAVLEQIDRHLTPDADYDVDGSTVWVNAVLYKPRTTAYRRGRKVDVGE